MDGELGKTKYYAWLVEFQERGSPTCAHFYFDPKCSKCQQWNRILAFIEKNISINLPDTVEQPEVFELVSYIRFIPIRGHLWNIKRTSASFCMVGFFTDRTIISKLLNSEML